MRTVAEYVDFTHSRVDLLLAAEKLIAEGAGLHTSTGRQVHGIRSQEADPDTFPKDDKFVVEFLKNYDSHPVLDAILKQGEYLVQIGQHAADAILNYFGQELENAAALKAQAEEAAKLDQDQK
jgi:hypothetical protein